jgi:hypothetical protein
MKLLVAALPLLLACSDRGSIQGTLVDGLSGAPRGGQRVLAQASHEDPACQLREAVADAQGTFRIESTCPETTYRLSLADESLQIANGAGLSGAGEVEAGRVEVWRAPVGPGLYRLREDRLATLRSHSDIASETTPDGQKVQYPVRKPWSAPLVDDGAWLVVSGELSSRVAAQPLVVDQGTRSFRDDVTMTDHAYIGARFDEAGALSPVVAEMDMGRLRRIQLDDRAVLYIPADALPAGRYTLAGEGDRRGWVVDFGRSMTPPEAEGLAPGDASAALP